MTSLALSRARAAPSAKVALAICAGAGALAVLRQLALRWRAKPPPPPAADLSESERAVADAAFTWAALHGLLVRAPPDGSPHWTHAPIALRPTPYPRAEFERALALAPLFGRLVDRVARDVAWLHQTLEETAASDPFTAKLLAISAAVHAKGETQRAKLGIHRSDYMLHAPAAGTARGLLQVELNTIASSFGCLSALVSAMHAHLDPRAGAAGALPLNPALEALPDALAAGHAHYVSKAAGGAAKGGTAAATAAAAKPTTAAANGRPLVVLFVVQPAERNTADQQLLAAALTARSAGVRVVRRSLKELAACARLDASALAGGRRGALVLSRVPELEAAEAEVSVVYFRAGYTPDDYPSETEWLARTLVEKSVALKCPCIDYHLAGAKKVQQALALHGAVERFLAPAEAAAVRECFAGLWSLDALDAPLRAGGGGGADGPTLREAVLADPDGFVMKPQREGGGNNWYGAAIPPRLQALGAGEGAAYILMERIRPPPQPRALLLRAERALRASTLSELGIFTAFLSDGEGAELLNTYAGHLLRTKPEEADEGGVAAGFAVLDSPLLV